jgi:hypothetical protein
MNTIIGVFANLHSVVSCVWRLLGYVLGFLLLVLRPKAVLAAKIPVLGGLHHRYERVAA